MDATFDEKGLKVLSVVDALGGEATTTEIRARSGLSNADVHYRFEKLEGRGLVDLSYAEDGHGERNPPRVASLTGKGEMEIERGLIEGDEGFDGLDYSLEEEDYLNKMDNLEKSVDRLKSRVDTMASVGAFSDVGDRGIGGSDNFDSNNMSQRVDDLESKLDEVLNRVEQYEDVDLGERSVGVSSSSIRDLDSRVGEIESTLDGRLDSMESELDKLREYVFGWTEHGETYLTAIQSVLESKLDISLESYLEPRE